MIQEANRAAMRLLQCSSVDTLMGKPLVAFVAQDGHDAFRSRLNQLVREDIKLIEDWHLVMQPRAGFALTTLVTVGVIRDAVSRLIGVRWLIRPAEKLKG